MEIKGLFGSTGDQALVLRNQEMGSINPPAEGQAGYRSAPSTHGYLVYAGRGKRSALSRVPTHFRPESPLSRRKTFYFQYGGCAGYAQICLLTANSGHTISSQRNGTSKTGFENRARGDTLPLSSSHPLRLTVRL